MNDLAAWLPNDENKKKGSFYENVYNNSMSWPPCFEKSLVKCLNYVSMKKENNNTDEYENSKAFDLVEEWDFMKKRSEIEGLDNEENTLFLNNLKTDFQNHSWESAFTKLEKKYQRMKVLDVHMIFHLIFDLEKVANLSKDKDIVCIFGGAKASKAEVVNHLLGYKKIGTEEKDLMMPVLMDINYTEFGIDRRGSVGLCVTPNDEDTKRMEVKAANAIFFKSLFKSCKTVRPVVLISSKGLQFEKIKELVHEIMGVMQDLKSHISSFSFLLVSFSEEEKKEVTSLLNTLKGKVQKNCNSDVDANLQLFIDEFESKIKKEEIKYFDDKNTQNDTIWQYFLSVKPIEQPENVFNVCINTQLYDTIIRQIHIYQNEIATATKFTDFNYLKFKLNELKFLGESLNLDKVKSFYEERIDEIKKMITSKHEKMIKDFNYWIETAEDLDENYLKSYKEHMGIVKASDSFSLDLNLKNVPSSEILNDNIYVQCKIIFDKIKKSELDDKHLKTLLDKLKLLSENFVKTGYNTHLLDDKVFNRVSSLKETINGKDCVGYFKQISSLLSKISKLKEHIFEEILKETESELKDVFILSIETEINAALYSLKNDVDYDQKHVENLSKLICNLQSVINESRKLNLFHADITLVYETFEYNIVEYLNQMNYEILKGFEEGLPRYISNIGCLFKKIFLISKLPIKSTNIPNTSSILISICDQIEKLKRDICKSIKLDCLDFEDTILKLTYLEKSKWIDYYKQNFYNDHIKDIRRVILNVVSNLSQYDLKLENSENVGKVYLKIIQLSQLENLEFLTSEDETFAKAKKSFCSKTNTVLDNIRKIFKMNIEEEQVDLDIENKLNFHQLSNISKAENALKYLSICKEIDFLDKVKHQNTLNELETYIRQYFEILRKEIEKVLDKITSYSGSETKEFLLENSRHLCNLILELIEIERNPHVSLRFNIFQRTLFDMTKRRIENFLFEIQNEIHAFEANRALSKAEIKLQIAKALLDIDELIGMDKNKGFHALCNTLQKSIQDMHKNLIKNFTENFNLKRFIYAETDLAEERKLNESFYKKTVTFLHTRLDELWEETIFKTRCLTTITSENADFDRIVGNLNLLKDAEGSFKTSIEMEKFLENKKNVKDNLNLAFFEDLNRISFYIENLDLEPANIAINTLKAKVKKLDLFYVKEMILDLKKLKEKLEERLRRLKETYENRSIEDFWFDSPINDFEKINNSIKNPTLKNVDLDLLKNCLKDLSKIIVKKFEDKIISLRELTLKEIKAEIERLELYLSKIPDIAKDLVVFKLKQLKKEIEENQTIENVQRERLNANSS